MFYALHINETSIELVTALNGGVRPVIEEEGTWLLFDQSGVVPNDIVTEQGLMGMTDEIHIIGSVLILEPSEEAPNLKPVF